jgi:hypothetical protein
MKYGRWALAAAAALLHNLPTPIQRIIATTQLPAGSSAGVVEAALSIAHPVVAVNALFLALDEMNEIRDLDSALAARVGPKIVAYYGEGDQWNQVGDHLKVAAALGPSSTVHLCSEGHPHGFVLHPHSVSRVAEKCWEWLSKVVH